MVILLYNSPPPFPYTCHSAVQSTLHHLSPCTAILPTLDMPIWPVPLSHHTIYSLLLLSVSVCNTSVAQYSVCYAVITLLSVSPCSSPLHNHSNLSSPPISCLSTLLIYRPCISLPYQFLFKHSPHLPSVCFAFIYFLCTRFGQHVHPTHIPASSSVDSRLVHCFHGFILPTWSIWWSSNNAARWQMGFNLVFRGLKAFTNWSSACFLLRCAAVLIVCAVCVASVCSRPLRPPLLPTHNEWDGWGM